MPPRLLRRQGCLSSAEAERGLAPPGDSLREGGEAKLLTRCCDDVAVRWDGQQAERETPRGMEGLASPTAQCRLGSGGSMMRRRPTWKANLETTSARLFGVAQLGRRGIAVRGYIKRNNFQRACLPVLRASLRRRLAQHGQWRQAPAYAPLWAR